MAAVGGAVVAVGVSAGPAVAGAVPSGAPAMMATAGDARVGQAGAFVHGCPSGGVCEYLSKAAYRKDKPTVIDTKVPGYFYGGTQNRMTVNNTASDYSSEGYLELRMFKSAYYCLYVVDPQDEQDPGATEHPADGANVTAIATGTTAKAVDMNMILPLGDCE